MKTSDYKTAIKKILKAVSAGKTMSQIFKGRAVARGIARKVLREIEREERGVKRMKWRGGNGKWASGVYVIHKLDPLPFEKNRKATYWLGKNTSMNGSFGISSVLPDLETAKQIVYLISTKK